MSRSPAEPCTPHAYAPSPLSPSHEPQQGLEVSKGRYARRTVGAANLPRPPGSLAPFGHGGRKWELFIPGGFRDPIETEEEAVARELEEETGLQAVTKKFLGSVNPDSSLLANLVPVYLVDTREGADLPHNHP